jgi:hypothetical protein
MRRCSGSLVLRSTFTSAFECRSKHLLQLTFTILDHHSILPLNGVSKFFKQVREIVLLRLFRIRLVGPTHAREKSVRRCHSDASRFLLQIEQPLEFRPLRGLEALIQDLQTFSIVRNGRSGVNNKVMS